MEIYTKTFDVFFEETKIELLENEWKLKDVISMKGNFEDDHYKELIENVKNGSLITSDVFNNLDSLKQYHFNKHYNAYNDRIIN